VELDEYAQTMVARVRSRPWGMAVAALAGGATHFAFDPGDDPIDERSLFQLGSVTKTMTGVLLADAVQRGEVTTATTVGALLGFEGGAASVTLGALATQHSGLPRLPPNLDVQGVDPADPYAGYTRSDLVEGLRATEVGPPLHGYSNFGFMTLGACLTAASGRPMGDLLHERLFTPLGMTGAGCPPPEAGRLPGYDGPVPTPWWTTHLPGSGGVGASIADVAVYLAAHLAPPDAPLGDAIRTASTIQHEGETAMGFGWVHQGGGWWHNGGTGGFRSFVAFHPPSSTAVALLANSGSAEMLDAVGFRTLTEMIAGS
jgi:CubicO group peptidase (beta-lactamase class C family)